MKLYGDGIISYEDAMAHVTNPDEFNLKLRGIKSSSDAGWTDFEGRG
jgi:twitching motility protein PilT